MANSFVYYETFAAAIEDFYNRGMYQEAAQLAMAINAYGLRGEEIFSDVPAVIGSRPLWKLAIDNAQDRYSKAKEDGKKGGRPKKYSDDDLRQMLLGGKSREEIMEATGYSKKTLDRRLPREVPIGETKLDKRGFVQEIGETKGVLSKEELDKIIGNF